MFPTTPMVQTDLSREELVGQYTLFQQSRVSTEKQKDDYSNAGDLTLERCWDLDLIASNEQWILNLYREDGIPEGVAWHYVCNVKHFLKLQQGSQSLRNKASEKLEGAAFHIFSIFLNLDLCLLEVTPRDPPAVTHNPNLHQ